MRRAAIVAPLRTGVGAFGGSLKALGAEQLASTVLKALIERSGIDPARIDEVISAQSYANSEAPCMGRWAALDAGLPIYVAGYNLDRRCGSGLQAVVNAAMQVQTGASDVVAVLGVESMSNIEYYSTDMRWGSRAGSVALHDRLQRGRERSQPEHRFGIISGMPETAENLAREIGITRDESDAFAVRSHRHAAAAWAAGPACRGSCRGARLRRARTRSARPSSAAPAPAPARRRIGRLPTPPQHGDGCAPRTRRSRRA